LAFTLPKYGSSSSQANGIAHVVAIQKRSRSDESDSALPKPGCANYEKQANGLPEKDCHHENRLPWLELNDARQAGPPPHQ